MLAAAPAFAADDDTITIGMTLSQTGALNVDFPGQQRGAEMLARRGQCGRRHQGRAARATRSSSSPTTTSPPGGRVQQLYTRLIVQDKAQFLFSPYSSGLVATAAVISRTVRQDHAGRRRRRTENIRARQQASVPGNHPGRLLSRRRGGGTEGEESARQDRRGLFRRSVLQGRADRDEGSAKKAGLEVVLDESHAPTTTDFGPIINKIISSRPTRSSRRSLSRWRHPGAPDL